jgi:hypothetical protein
LKSFVSFIGSHSWPTGSSAVDSIAPLVGVVTILAGPASESWLFLREDRGHKDWYGEFRS